MPSGDNQFIGPHATADDRERVHDGLVGPLTPLGPHGHAQRHRPVAQVIPEREAALPLLRHRLTLQSAEDLFGVGVADGQHRNCGDGHRVGRQPSGPLRRGPARSRGIPPAVVQAAPLHRLRRAHGAVGVDVAAEEAVVSGIGVQHQSHGTSSLRFARLDSAETLAIPGDDHRALDRLAQGIQHGVVVRQSVIGEHYRPGHVPCPAVPVHRRPHPALRRPITGDRRLGYIERQLIGRHQLEASGILVRQEHAKQYSRSVEPEFVHRPQHMIGGERLGRCSGYVGRRGERLHVVQRGTGVGGGPKLGLQPALMVARRSRVSNERLLCGQRNQRDQHRQRKQSTHGAP